MGSQPQPFTEVFNIAGKLLADAGWSKGSIALLVAIVTFLLPTEFLQDMAIWAGVLIVLDTVTGFVASLVSGKSITSARFSRALVKSLAYLSVIIVAAIAGRVAPGLDGLDNALVGGALVYVIGTEGISVIENIKIMGVQPPDWLTTWLRDRLESSGPTPGQNAGALRTKPGESE